MRTAKDNQDKRDRKIFDMWYMWLACHTQEEIAKRENIDQGDLSRMSQGFMEIGNLAESHKVAASHATDFEVPLYNVWKMQEKTPLPPIRVATA